MNKKVNTSDDKPSSPRFRQNLNKQVLKDIRGEKKKIEFSNEKEIMTIL